MLIYTNEELERIIYRFKDMVYRVAVTHTRNTFEADDVFQEVFLRLVRCEKPFASEEHLKAWLLRLTINCACDLHRSTWAKRVVSYDDALGKKGLSDDGDGIEPLWTNSDATDDLLQEVTLDAVKHLPATLRSVIYLYYYERMDIAEVARTLGLRPNAVKTRLSRARSKLKKALGAIQYAQQTDR